MSDNNPDNNIFDSSLSWEASKEEMFEKSERKAWMIAYVAVGVVVILAIAIMLMLPLKKDSPFVLRVDSVTGGVDVITHLNESQKVEFEEVMDKYWLNKYVESRETYDWFTLQSDYEIVGLLSSQSVAEEYNTLWTGKDALDKRYGKNVKVTTNINSIILSNPGIANVRFTKTIKNNDNNTTSSSKWIASIAYEYQTISLLSEIQRRINPFGFQVLSYRFDPEVDTGGAK